MWGEARGNWRKAGKKWGRREIFKMENKEVCRWRFGEHELSLLVCENDDTFTSTPLLWKYSLRKGKGDIPRSRTIFPPLASAHPRQLFTFTPLGQNLFILSRTLSPLQAQSSFNTSSPVSTIHPPIHPSIIIIPTGNLCKSFPCILHAEYCGIELCPCTSISRTKITQQVILQLICLARVCTVVVQHHLGIEGLLQELIFDFQYLHCDQSM